jgi:hypothetical protein
VYSNPVKSIAKFSSLFIIAVTLIAGCSGLRPEIEAQLHTQTPTVSASETAQPTQLPLPSATPDLRLKIEILAYEIVEDTGTIKISGMLHNTSEISFSDVILVVELSSLSGLEQVQTQFTPPLSTLLPGRRSPFTLEMGWNGDTPQINAHITDFATSRIEGIDLEYQLKSTCERNDGRFQYIGEIHNPGPLPASIQTHIAYFQHPENTAVTLATGMTFPRQIPEEGIIPFGFLLDEMISLDKLTIVSDSQVSDAPLPELQLVRPAAFSFDSQNNPMLQGWVENSSPNTSIPQGIVALYFDEVLFSVGPVPFGFPLLPGEQGPFTLTKFPCWSSIDGGIERDTKQLRAELFLDPALDTYSPESIESLSLQVTSYTSPGSRAFIKGRIETLEGMNYDQILIQAILTVPGKPVFSSGWMSLENWDTVDEQTFTLPMALPEGLRLAEAEIDIRALGLSEKEP